MADTLLDIVDENDEVTGEALRSEVHKNGLLHREVNIWFVTPGRKIIFQKRGLSKQDFPGLLMNTVGGHVDPGETYIEAALREISEETGVVVNQNELVYLSKKRFDITDPATLWRNNVHQVHYGFLYKGELTQLKPEATASGGFVEISLDNVFALPGDQKEKIIPLLLDREVFGDIYEALKKMIEG